MHSWWGFTPVEVDIKYVEAPPRLEKSLRAFKDT